MHTKTYKTYNYFSRQVDLIAKLSIQCQFAEFALYSLVCSSVCPSVVGTSSSPSLLKLFNSQTMFKRFFLKAYHLAMTMTETKTYKKTNTKKKTHIHIKRKIQSAYKTQCML